MILHITFSDGSNPWVCCSQDRREIAEHWREWMKYHAEEARPVARFNNWRCEPGMLHGYFVIHDGHPWQERKYYKRLGNALAALERLGGENI